MLLLPRGAPCEQPYAHWAPVAQLADVSVASRRHKCDGGRGTTNNNNHNDSTTTNNNADSNAEGSDGNK